MERRAFIVLHTGGAQEVQARSAREAVQRCSLPGGSRHARGVVRADLVVSANVGRALSIESPFIAVIGQPV